jgi:hypothetical protein
MDHDGTPSNTTEINNLSSSSTLKNTTNISSADTTTTTTSTNIIITEDNEITRQRAELKTELDRIENERQALTAGTYRLSSTFFALFVVIKVVYMKSSAFFYTAFCTRPILLSSPRKGTIPHFSRSFTPLYLLFLYSLLSVSIL